MSIRITLKRGLDISITGEAGKTISEASDVRRCATVPDDFHGFTPKVEVKPGDNVLCGTPILFDKNHPEIKLVSPISGIVTSVVRGERRKIERVIITSDGQRTPKKFPTGNLNSADEIKTLLMASGLWAMMRKRPFDIIPSPDDIPRDIFVTAFDSSPLAPDYEFILKGKENELEAGAGLLAKLTDGKIYFSTRPDSKFLGLKHVEHVEIDGPHPAGNAGIQAANISPTNKGETIWTLDAITLARIGTLALDGIVPSDTVVAITGSEITSPKYIRTVIGAEISPLINGNTTETGHRNRIISGNVLTGVKVTPDGFLRYPYRHITVIPEGDDIDEFMGWASPGFGKMSVNRSFIGHFRCKRFAPDARILGGRRAIIMSGEYDKVLPMDILAEYLLKAIMSRNIDDMENLGIYEIAPEDMALCEYVDTSKLEIQKIVREGLDFLRKELA